jgi:spermidine synthase
VPELSNCHPRPLDLRFSPPAALLGFVAATWQIYLIREFAAQFHGSELTFSFVLAAWLLGGGLGGLRAGRLSARPRTAGLWFSTALLAAPAVFAGLRCSRWILGTLPGEVTSLAPILAFALASSLLLNFPLGAAVVRMAGQTGAAVARIYLWESAGAAAGGAISSLLFIPLFPDWTALALVQTATAAAVFFLFRKSRSAVALIAAALLAPAGAVMDEPLQKAVWRPFHLVAARDGPYGRLQIIKTGELITVYDNGARAFSIPDPAAAEEAVHIPMLLHGHAETALLIGGGIGGGLGEILKYPVRSVVAVEIDGHLAATVRPYLDSPGRSALDDPRVRLVLTDGRVHLERTADRYDVIIVAVPEPSTAQFNRFYTAEFFRLVKRRLAPGGVFSFKVGAAENFMSAARRAYLSALRATLTSAFREIAIVPGDNAVFAASDSPLSADADGLAEKMRKGGIRTLTLTPEALRERLHPLRTEIFKGALDEPAATVNSDLRPSGYFFQTLLWSEQRKGLEAGVLGLAAQIPPWMLLAVPLFIFVAALLRAAFRPRPGAASSLPVGFLGFSTIVVEILAIVRFQALYGSFYGSAARLLTMMMAGLALGAWIGGRGRMSLMRTAVLQARLLVLIAAAFFAAAGRPPEFAFDLYLLSWGLLSGYFFVAAVRTFPPPRGGAGRPYAWDLLGSFVGAVALTAIYVPRTGIPPILFTLSLAAVGLLAYLSWPRRMFPLP